MIKVDLKTRLPEKITKKILSNYERNPNKELSIAIPTNSPITRKQITI
jgi:hypothetical protein